MARSQAGKVEATMRPHKSIAKFPTSARVTVAAFMIWSVAVGVSSNAGASPSFVRPPQFAPGRAPGGSVPLGVVPAAQAMQLSVVLPPSHADELQSLLAGLYDPSSALYHQWLRPGQFVSRFAPAASDINAVRSWLQSKGMATGAVSGFALRASAPERPGAGAVGPSVEGYRTPGGSGG